MYTNIFSRLFYNVKRLQNLNIPRYSWTIEMKVLELNCEIDNFITKVLKKRADDEILKQNKDLKNISNISNNSQKI